MRENPANVSYGDLHTVCVEHFGEPRQRSGSHAVFKTQWPGDPRVNIQPGRGSKAKPYQVKQVLAAIDMLHGLQGGEDQ
ncbi:toxin HicA [Mycobacterium haemophilum]|uniref:Toxin HicA n=2 Tax=Mycobacterium haemophilum TaxID=29311 RepID=A0A0I9V3J6_9MYCO|nr:toxin HicA [Mycobacterium haemophilum]KLO25944.1 toxin HicA [Mycobacterium haemophilum]KLO37530.1 toxin HicA [Mycobacterium haemophilum]KLO44079.1 toxin HicA [Mycobacterium haemophilum]KLO49345.1 toxin HicA [Mycobacterium haemophilum]